LERLLKKEIMLSSDFKAAIRNIFRNKVPSAISILGLGIGLGCIILLLALIIHEKSFDRHIPGYKCIQDYPGEYRSGTASSCRENEIRIP
jgi:putative ABC transport system permease protein